MGSWLLRILCIVVLGTAGCITPRDSQGHVTSFRTSSTPPTAVGETLAVQIEALDEAGAPVSPSDYELTDATCDLPGCAAAADPYAKTVWVRSDVPGLARVSVTVKASPTPLALTIPFRVATRIIMTRAMDDSPAGSAFAMVAGDTQSWFVAAGDEQGPLVAPVAATLDPAPVDEEGLPPCYPDGSIPYGEPTRLMCRFGSKTATVFDITVSYKTLRRTETVKVIPLGAVRAASLLRCHTTQHREGDASESRLVPDRIEVEAKSPPCEPALSLRYPSPSCRSARDWKVVPRLVLDDGTVALGGAQYLSTDGAGAEAAGDIDYMTTGSGNIIGRFGTATVDVPYAVDAFDAPCSP